MSIELLEDKGWIGRRLSPLLLLPVRLLPHWHGTTRFPIPYASRGRREHYGARLTDYDRARAVPEHGGIIDVFDGQGLVLGKERLATTWCPEPWGGRVVRWAGLDEDPFYPAWRSPAFRQWDELGQLVIVDSPVQIFNSAEVGLEWASIRLVFDLWRGVFTVRSARFEHEGFPACWIELRDASK